METRGSILKSVQKGLTSLDLYMRIFTYPFIQRAEGIFDSFIKVLDGNSKRCHSV